VFSSRQVPGFAFSDWEADGAILQGPGELAGVRAVVGGLGLSC
jgi:hypothetical protein